MGTKERRRASEDVRTPGGTRTLEGARTPGAGPHAVASAGYGPEAYDEDDQGDEYVERRELWIEEPATRRRLPDPVRSAAVRAVLIVSLTLIQAMTAFFCTMAESWLAFPMVLSSVASTIGATWSVCDVWVTRQVWNQRNGVVSMPSSSARQLRRERRRARRDARAAARSAATRSKEDIRSRGGAGGGARGQLSHP
ncbi:hypothetical protein GPA10_21850 [Streptomyces sp. p1417]|uniref:Uncharacterized protein n=1 Tax=Streptomyces typhae TaxID=2681492 RepID=A0A6L6X0N0_9ACTN|nr:hypothetical protein [Streptomyces typhae]MVO87334.1 hypothetical protein [Streptomyces typhae]